MNLLAVILTVLAGLCLLSLPRRWATLPLLIGISYMSTDSSVDLGALHFTGTRILVAIGVLRVILRGERIEGGMNTLDRMLIAWAAWTVCSSFFHDNPSAALIFRLGLVYNCLGFYFLLRVFIQDANDILSVFKIVLIALVPIALEMLIEAGSGRDLFSMLGGVPDLSEVRGDKVRAQGPFTNPILAGSVGAVCLPMAILFWKKNRKLALLGLAAAGSVVVTSRSSGPILTLFFTIMGLACWKFRRYMRQFRWGVLIGIILLNMVMQVPVYYLLDRINLTGHSTGWHRAQLIDSAINHVGDWWLGGTDYTRDWTPESGYDKNDTDITNHYIRMAVWGGLPMLLLFVGSLIAAFGLVAKALQAHETAPFQEQFIIWTLGCILFGHLVTMISVSYFDQTVFFLYLILAAIGSLRTSPAVETALEGEIVCEMPSR
jgi:hypothetical protein